jgi:hypothetical protein
VTVEAQDEQPRAGSGPGFGDAVTFSFGDADAEVYALARIGLSPGSGGEAQASGLGILFAGRDPVAVRAAGGLPAAGGWDAVDAAGVRTTVVEPLSAWTLSFASEDGAAGFDVEVRAVSAPAVLVAEDEVARVGGTEGYEQLCRFTGSARVRGGRRRIDCLGQRGHAWGQPDWERLALTRTVGAWLGEDLGVSLAAVRTVKDKSHADEAVAATLWAAPGDDDVPSGGPDGGSPGARAQAVAIAEPRLSTTLDGEGRQRRAGLELFEDPEGYAHRGAGQVVCGTSLDLGRLRLDCAFFAWQLEGRAGLGRYDVLRRA